MACTTARNSAAAWALARRQHWVITRAQLLALGFTRSAIEHRLASGRLRRFYRGVYAVGPRECTQLGRWMAAVLACPPGALLSHRSAGALWGVVRPHQGAVEVTASRAPAGIRHYRGEGKRTAQRCGIPVTTPAATLVDLASRLGRTALEAAIGEADRLGLVDPERLREQLPHHAGRSGVAPLRRTLDRHTFVLTHSELERLFLPIAGEAGLPPPDGQEPIGPFRVDFWWSELDLVVETDGLRYHRTAARQGADLKRGNSHVLGARRQLRFSHAQIRYERSYVRATLSSARGGPPSSPAWWRRGGLARR